MRRDAGAAEAVKRWARDQLDKARLHAVWPLVHDPTSGHLWVEGLYDFVGVRIARSKGSGIAGRVGSVPGKAAVDLYSFDGTTLADSGRDAPAYNLAAGGVAPNAWLILLKVLKYWFVIWEECPP